MVPEHFESFLLVFPNTGACSSVPFQQGLLGAQKQGLPPKAVHLKVHVQPKVGCVLCLKMKTEKCVKVSLFPCCSPEVLLFEEYSSVRETNRDVGFKLFFLQIIFLVFTHVDQI